MLNKYDFILGGYVCMFDNTSAWASPSSRRGFSEAANAEYYISRHPELRQMIRECNAEVETLLNHYSSVLEISDRIKAKTLNTFIREASDYRYSFMVNVLFMSYHVWDDTHKKYLEILRLLAEYNPEYLRSAVADHARKLRICKVEVHQI